MTLLTLVGRPIELVEVDRVAPPADTTALVTKLAEQKGITVTHTELEGADHFFKEPHMDTMIDNVTGYVKRRLTENTR